MHSSDLGAKKVPAAGVCCALPPVLVYQLRRRPLEFLTEVGQKHPIVRLGWAGAPLYFVNEPQLVRELLCDTSRFVKGSILKKLEIIVGRGLIMLNGDEWRDARRRVQTAFRRELFPKQQAIIARHTGAMIARLEAQADRPVNLEEAMNELTFRIALELFLGADPDQVEDMAGLRGAMDTLNAYAKWRLWTISSPHWRTERNQEFWRALQTLEDVVENVVRARKAQSPGERAQRADVLSLLLAEGFDGRPLRDHVMTMLIAGHETTAATLSFLWAHVARQPDLQERLCREAAAWDGATSVAVESLPMAEAIWNETLRLYPAVPLLDRQATEEATLGGYRIPRGANVLWSAYVMHRTPEHWPLREDPNAFMPKAFLYDPPPTAGAFIPFGEGPRMCLGKSLADLEALTVVSLFARAFRIEPVESDEIRVKALVTLRPEGGVPVKLAPRVAESDVDALATVGA